MFVEWIHICGNMEWKIEWKTYEDLLSTALKMRLGSPYRFSDFVISWVCSVHLRWNGTHWAKKSDHGNDSLTSPSPVFSALLLTTYWSSPLAVCWFPGIPGIARSWLHHGGTQGGDPRRRGLAEALPRPGNPALPVPPAGQQDQGAVGRQGESWRAD